jgi:hypothetical protein
VAAVSDDYDAAIERLLRQAASVAAIPPPVLGPPRRPRTFLDALREVGISDVPPQLWTPQMSCAPQLRWWERLFC